MPRHRSALSVKEHAFIRHFLAGQPGVRGNATRAYVAAGYAPKAAYSGASELLRKPRIHDAIAQRLARREIRADQVLEELRRIAFADLRDVAAWGPDGVILKASDELSPEVAATIAEVIEHSTDTKYGKDRHLRVKLHDKLGALGLLAKHLGLVREKLDVSGTVWHGALPKGFFEAVTSGDPSQLAPGVLTDEATPPA